MAILIRADGSEAEVRPANGREFTLEEMQGYVGGDIQLLTLPDGKELVLNEEGKLLGLPVNSQATMLGPRRMTSWSVTSWFAPSPRPEGEGPEEPGLNLHAQPGPGPRQTDARYPTDRALPFPGRMKKAGGFRRPRTTLALSSRGSRGGSPE